MLKGGWNFKGVKNDFEKTWHTRSYTEDEREIEWVERRLIGPRKM